VGPTLSDRALAEIVAARASAAGLAGDFAGHSLRGGFATAAAWARPLGGRDHAPRALEKRADRPPLHPPRRHPPRPQLLPQMTAGVADLGFYPYKGLANSLDLSDSSYEIRGTIGDI
jgi:hypothetical protein